MMMPPPPPPCEYPAGATGDLAVDHVLPELAWSGARAADGTALDFAARDFFCDDAYEGYSSMILLVSAGWCSACPQYIAMLNRMQPSLEAQGTLVVYVEVETAGFEPATSDDAIAFIDESCAPDEFEGGLRIGDAGNLGQSVRDAVRQFPSAYFVRRRDMRIVADQSESAYVIDFMSLATDPEQTWTPVEPPFQNRCMPGDEEASEPNDDFARAVEIAIGAAPLGGGICAAGSDFYHVSEAGPWRFDLRQSLFTTPEPAAHNVDLRLYTEAMERIGGSNTIGNHDWVDYEGPAYVEVYAAHGASGAYDVSLAAR